MYHQFGRTSKQRKFLFSLFSINICTGVLPSISATFGLHHLPKKMALKPFFHSDLKYRKSHAKNELLPPLSSFKFAPKRTATYTPPHLPQEHAINVAKQKHDVHHKHLHPIFHHKKQRKISDPVRFLKSDHPHV